MEAIATKLRAIAARALKDWDSNHDSRVGKTLTALSNPTYAEGYRADISELHKLCAAADSVIAAKDAEIERLKSRLASLPADWNTDSSLETWFPYSAEEIERLRNDVAQLRARVAEFERDEFSLATLRSANLSRQAEWCADQVPDLSYRGNELAGEGGEVAEVALSLSAAIGKACNHIKKLERERFGWRGSRTTVEKLAEELADVVICADLVAITAGIGLVSAVVEKFNKTSADNGLATRLHHSPPMKQEDAP